MREVLILRSSITTLKQYNQYLLKRNEVLEGLVKRYKKFLEDLLLEEDLQNSLNKPKSF